MMKKVLVLSLVIFLMVFDAFASSDEVSDPLTEMDELWDFVKAECDDEYSKYCGDVVFLGGRIIRCMHQFEEKFSPKCKEAFHEAKERMDELLPKVFHSIDACEEDLQSTCDDLKPWSGKLIDCLRLNQDKISEECRTTLQDYGWMQ